MKPLLTVIVLLLGLTVLATVLAQESVVYKMLSWTTFSRGEAQTGLVRVSGRYLPHVGFTELVRGVITDNRFSLPVEGASFDWMPQAGARVEFWGALERTDRGYTLRFHNGRNATDTTRQPRPVMLESLREGQALRAWLKVVSGGSEPLPITTGTSENGVVFALPRYQGAVGVVCLEGTVARLGNNWSLTEARACPK